MNLNDLHSKIEKICPIVGISIGLEADKTTWKIGFKDIATIEQRLNAQSILDSYDVLTENQKIQARENALQFLQDSDTKLLRRIEELALGLNPFLDNTQYLALLQARQQARQALK